MPGRCRKDVRVAHLAIAHQPLDVRIFQKECRSLAAAGYEVHLVVAGASDGETREGVAMHTVKIPMEGSPIERWKQRLVATIKVARGIGAEIFHIHEPELIPVGLALKRTGTKVVYDAHEDAPIEAWSLNRGRPLHQFALPALWWSLLCIARLRFDAFVVVTPRIARRFPAAKTIEVRNYPRSELFPRPPRSDVVRSDHLIFAGLASQTRGAIEMLDALAALPEGSNIRLRLLGTINRPELEARMRRHTAWSRVDCLGYRPWSDVLDAYSRSLAGLLLYAPTLEQKWALPIKLFEYLLSGLPVVASDIAYWREVLDGNPAVTFVPYGNAQAAAAAIRQLADEPAEARKRGLAGAEHALARFRWDAEAARLVELYDRLSGLTVP